MKINQIYWPVTLFLLINSTLAIVLSGLYWWSFGWSWSVFWVALFFAGATNLSITAGYHRLFAHRSYVAHPLLRLVYLLVGASAFQGSALKWSSDHRRHHTHIDTEKDPYNIHRGFFFAHIGWLCLRETIDQKIHAPDLSKDALVAWQDRHFISLGVLVGYLLPALVCWLITGNVSGLLGGFIIAGSLRIFLTQQSTFFVNSLCHYLGGKTYSSEITARDSVIVAFLTHGEGYHNFHHTFQIDYRNGIRWYHWDPTKWTIWALSLIGLASKLRKIPYFEILRARLANDETYLRNKGIAQDKIAALKVKILHSMEQVQQMKQEYRNLKNELEQKKQHMQAEYTFRKDEMKHKTEEMVSRMETKLREIRTNIELTQVEFQMGLRQWRICIAA